MYFMISLLYLRLARTLFYAQNFCSWMSTRRALDTDTQLTIQVYFFCDAVH